MSTIKVDTLATRTGSGNITVSNNIAGGGTISGTNLSASGTLAVTGVYQLAANDYINLCLYAGGGSGSFSVQGSEPRNYFLGYLIG